MTLPLGSPEASSQLRSVVTIVTSKLALIVEEAGFGERSLELADGISGLSRERQILACKDVEFTRQKRRNATTCPEFPSFWIWGDDVG